jgi:hypothetical protein
MGSHILLAGVQSEDLSTLRIHQGGGVEAHDPVEDGKVDVQHCLVIEWSACNKNQGVPWEAG